MKRSTTVWKTLLTAALIAGLAAIGAQNIFAAPAAADHLAVDCTQTPPVLIAQMDLQEIPYVFLVGEELEAFAAAFVEVGGPLKPDDIAAILMPTVGYVEERGGNVVPAATFTADGCYRNNARFPVEMLKRVLLLMRGQGA